MDLFGPYSVPVEISKLLGGVIGQTLQALSTHDTNTVKNTIALYDGLQAMPEPPTMRNAAGVLSEYGIPRFYSAGRIHIGTSIGLSARTKREAGVDVGVEIKAFSIDVAIAASMEQVASSATRVEIDLVPTAPPDQLAGIVGAINDMIPTDVGDVPVPPPPTP